MYPGILLISRFCSFVCSSLIGIIFKTEVSLVLIPLVGDVNPKPTLPSFPTGSALEVFLSRSPLLSVILT